MEYGIIFKGDTTPLAHELSEALASLGLINKTTDTLTDELLTALNTYRRSNRLSVLDFCDPVALRTLGIEARGDELIFIARYVGTAGKTELEYYDLAAEIVSESRNLGITPTEAAARRSLGEYSEDIPLSAMLATVLAFVNQ